MKNIIIDDGNIKYDSILYGSYIDIRDLDDSNKMMNCILKSEKIKNSHIYTLVNGKWKRTKSCRSKIN